MCNQVNPYLNQWFPSEIVLSINRQKWHMHTDNNGSQVMGRTGDKINGTKYILLKLKYPTW